MSRRYQQIVTNFKPIVRNDKMLDRDWLVVPMVMMVEGVLTGNQGSIYYPGTEMGQIPAIWNHKPVVVYHPQENGNYGSACTPEELNVRSIGVIMNTKYENGKLLAEAWLDPARIEKVDARISEAIQNETTMELSTGLYVDVTPEEGTFNDVEYTGVAHNFRPDHLAVLPDIEGACSIEDGAGFLRVNQKFTTNEISNEDIQAQLSRLIREETPDDEYSWVDSVFDSYVVYERNNRLYQRDYEKGKDDVIKLIGLPVEVMRVVTYEIVNNKKDNSMEKEKLVNGLITNEGTQWSEDDREALMAMNEDALQKMVPVEKKEEPKKTPVQNAAEEGAKELKPVENKKTPEDYLKELPENIQAVLNHGLTTYNQQKADLVEKITTNERNTFSKEYLESKDVSELSAIAKLCEPVKNSADTRFNFEGNAPVVNSTDEEPLALPSTVS